MKKNHEYFMKIAILTSMNSTCIKKSVGAVIVRDGRLIATGYNGAPSGISHCTEYTCPRMNKSENQEPEKCAGLHAEENCIIQCAIHGTQIGENSTIYCTHFPCMNCAKMLINAGLKAIIFINDYEMDNVMKMNMLKESNIEIYKYHGNNRIKRCKIENGKFIE